MKRGFALCALALLVGLLALAPGRSYAADSTDTGFALQVTPSPIVSTVKPGTTTEIELKIRNASTAAETLKIAPRSFHIEDQNVKLDDSTPPEITDWITFSSPVFTAQPGEWVTEAIKIKVPESAGFSYSFALLISRQSETKPTESGRLIKGAVADFALINVDKPGASRKLDVAHFSSTKNLYEYLPSTFNISLRNDGNTIVQPYGNIFIQRGKNSTSPIATLPVNANRGYIIPGVTRTLSSDWTDGFPASKSYTAADGTTKQRLVWDWSKLSKLRVGHYTAKLVAVYDNGQSDVPLNAEISFWVLPWKILLVGLVIILLIVFGLWSIIRKTIRVFKKVKPSKKTTDSPKKDK
jgi:hypothetical protein